MNKYFLLNILIVLLFHPVLAQKNNFKINNKTTVEMHRKIFKPFFRIPNENVISTGIGFSRIFWR